MTRRAIILSFAFLIIGTGVSSGQETTALMQQAASLEKAFKDEEALQAYTAVLKREPSNIEALCRASELCTTLGRRQEAKEKQKDYYERGQQLAVRALKANPDYAEANFAMAIALGRIAQNASGDDKIKAVKDIRGYANRCIQLDPNNYKGYHVLGKWHFEVSDLSALEKWLVKVTYGALPKASLDDAIACYEKSRQLNPAFLLNYLELAKSYERKDDPKKARAFIEQMLKLPPNSSDDLKIKQLGRELLDDL